MTVSVSIPGKLMLAGEYAVLDGGACLASTLRDHMTVSAKVRAGGGYVLKSEIWPEALSFNDAADMDDGEPAIAALRRGIEKYGITGAELEIRSTFNITSGFGSSSAVRLGVLLALLALDKSESASDEDILELTREAIGLQRTHQQNASGYDFLTQMQGGLVQVDFAEAEPKVSGLKSNGDQLGRFFHPVIGGKGDATGKSVGSTLAWLLAEDLMPSLKMIMQELTTSMVALLQGDDQQLAAVLDANKKLQTLMSSSPNYPKALFAGLARLDGWHKTWTAKTTGAGGEDALLLIGSEAHLETAFGFLADQGWQRLQQAFGSCGASINKPGALNV